MGARDAAGLDAGCVDESHDDRHACPCTGRAASGSDRYRPGVALLEIGAGGGSIAGWLGDRVGATGSVVATDVDLQRLGDLGAPVEVRRHNIAREGLESAAYDLVHCRLVLQHLTEPVVALHKMATAVAPGGWLVVEEGDFGLLELAGAAESPYGARAR